MVDSRRHETPSSVLSVRTLTGHPSMPNIRKMGLCSICGLMAVLQSPGAATSKLSLTAAK